MSPTQWPRNLSAANFSSSVASDDARTAKLSSIALTTHSSAMGHSWSSSPVESRGRLTKCSDARCRGRLDQLHEARNVGNSSSCRMSAVTRWRAVVQLEECQLTDRLMAEAAPGQG